MVGQWTQVVKVSVYFTKNLAMSQKEFSDYYAHKHAALTSPILLRHKCISYSQYHCSAEKAKAQVEAIFGKEALDPQNPLQILPYDGCSSFVFRTLQDAKAFFHDPETAQVLEPDSANFINPAQVRVTIGEEFVVIQDSQPVA